jgi:hypothetical protein
VTTSSRALWLAVFATTAAIYLFTAHWQSGQVSDAIAASWPGWLLAHHGTMFLDGSAYPTDNFAIYPVHGHVVAVRTTGVVWAGIPVHLLLGWTGIGPRQGGALTAALMTAAAMANVSLLLRSLLPLRRALAATATIAFGTTAWTVASAELWTHGPDLLWLSTGLLAAIHGRHWIAGAAFGAAFLTRPHLAVIALLIGLGVTWDSRRLRTLLPYVATACVTFLVQLAWTDWYYGYANLLGPYETHVAVLEDGPGWGTNILGALVAPGCGLLLFSPVVVVAAMTIPSGWRSAPAWTRRAAVGGLLYVLIQMRLNHFSGGGGFYGYRLPLEGVVAAAPLGAYSWYRASYQRWVRVAGTVTAAASVTIIGFGALLAPYMRGGVGDWDVWYPWVVVKAAGIAAVPALLIVVSGVALGLMLLRRMTPAVAVQPSSASPR